MTADELRSLPEMLANAMKGTTPNAAAAITGVLIGFLPEIAAQLADLNTLLARSSNIQSANMFVAFELGFRAAERGLNLEEARAELHALIQER
jgi:hypothetical protein